MLYQTDKSYILTLHNPATLQPIMNVGLQKNAR